MDAARTPTKAWRPDELTALDITPTNVKVVGRRGRIDFVSDGQGYVPGYAVPGSPSQLFLEDKGHKTLLLTPSKRDTVVELNTETGQQLGEFRFATREDTHSAGAAMGVTQIVANTKWGNVEATGDTFHLNLVGPKSVAKVDLDTRVKHRDGVVDVLDDGKKKKSHTYGAGTSLTAGAVSSRGQLAVADKKGVVHLFKNPEDGMVRAKTNLDAVAVGEVTGVDVSADGKWVLWTLKDRLFLANVEFRDAKTNALTNGFDTPMGAQKSDVLELRLQPDELAAMHLTEDAVHFTAATFDNGPQSGGLEEVILTTTGDWVVTWKMRNVCTDYDRKRFLYATPGQAKCDRKAVVRRLDTVIHAHKFENKARSKDCALALEEKLQELKLSDF